MKTSDEVRSFTVEADDDGIREMDAQLTEWLSRNFGPFLDVKLVALETQNLLVHFGKP